MNAQVLPNKQVQVTLNAADLSFLIWAMAVAAQRAPLPSLRDTALDHYQTLVDIEREAQA
jgi:hypothetical protein